MSVIHIPATADAAVTELGSLGRLINARKWERAAIVAALVGPAPGQGARTDLTSGKSPRFPFTAETLAALGMIGLRDPKQIRHYRDVWCRHRSVPTLGERVDLSDLPEWPGIPEEELAAHTGMTPERKENLLAAGREAGMPTGAKVVDVAANPKAMAAAIKADPEVAKAAYEALEERHLRDHPRPELSAQARADIAAIERTMDAAASIHMKVMQAAAVLHECQTDWDQHYAALSERERREVDAALNEITAIVGTLQMYRALD